MHHRRLHRRHTGFEVFRLGSRFQGIVYMGLIHALHVDGGMEKQMQLIKTHIPDFGVAAPCGFGRGPAKMTAQTGLATPNDYMEGLIADQIKAVEMLREVRGS